MSFLPTFSIWKNIHGKDKNIKYTTQNIHVHEELEALENAVNDFIEQNNSGKIISVSDTATVNADGRTMGLIHVVAYE